MYDFFIISSVIVVMFTLFSIRSGITQANQISTLKLYKLQDIIKELQEIKVSVGDIEIWKLLYDIENDLSSIESSVSSIELSVNSNE